MSKIQSIISIILCNIWGCAYSAYPFLLCWLWGFFLLHIIFIKSDVWPIWHRLGSGHETMVCAVCLFIFLQHFGLQLSTISSKMLCERDTAKFYLRNLRMRTAQFIVMTLTDSTFMEHYISFSGFYGHKLGHHLSCYLILIGYLTRLYVTARILIKHIFPWKFKD